MIKIIKIAPYYIPNEEENDAASDVSSIEENTPFSKSLREVFVKYAEIASMNGVNVINTAKNSKVKVIWLLLLLTTMGFMAFHLYMLMNRFFLRPTKTSVKLNFSALPFPAITVCNVNAMRKSQQSYVSKEMRNIIKSMSLEEQMSSYVDTRHDNRSTTEQPYSSGYPATTGWPSPDDTTNIDTSKNENPRTWEETAKQSNFSANLDKFFSEFSKLNKSTRAMIGHQIKSMLYKCTFAGRICEAKNFTRTYSATYGNCYTIESNMFYAMTSGPSGGLELILFLDTDEYLPGITSGEGAQVVIHEQGTFPFPDEEGIAVSSGAQTLIGLKQLSIERLGFPYGECNDDTEFNNTYGFKCRRNLCQKICLERKVRDTCNCYDGSILEVNDILKIPNKLQPCPNKTDPCVARVYSDITNNDETCDCSSPCNEYAYQKSVSSRYWPDKDLTNFLIGEMCKTQNLSVCDKVGHYGYQYDFLKFNVYFEDLNYEKISEHADYEVIQVLSDVGGSIGLWIGLSLLSLFELLHLIIDVVVLAVRHMSRKE